MKKLKKPALLLYNYGSVISIILFVIGSLLLARNIPNFSFFRFTISEIYLFSGSTGQKVLYYLFVSKFFLDIIFSISIFRKLPIKIYSPAAILWFLPVVSFGALGFLPAGGDTSSIHLFLSIVMLFSWFSSEYVFAKLTGNPYFYTFSKKFILFQLILMLGFALTGYLNGLFEIIYFGLSLLWLWTFLLVLDLR